MRQRTRRATVAFAEVQERVPACALRAWDDPKAARVGIGHVDGVLPSGTSIPSIGIPSTGRGLRGGSRSVAKDGMTLKHCKNQKSSLPHGVVNGTGELLKHTDYLSHQTVPPQFNNL